MSAAAGFPDWQRITQWLGPPLVQNTGLVIGAGTHTDGPVQVSNFASVIVALKATGGNVTVTVKQTVPAGPASLVLTQQVIVAAGGTLFEAFVLYGGAVELDLTGSVAGTSVDYALYGSNTTTNAQVITNATINVQKNEVLVAAEPTLDFVDHGGAAWTITDDAVNTRVKIQLPNLLQLPTGIGGHTISFGNGVFVWPGGSTQATDVVVNHGNPGTPTVILLCSSMDGVNHVACGYYGIGAAQFTARAYTTDGFAPPLNAQNVFSFVAIA